MPRAWKFSSVKIRQIEAQDKGAVIEVLLEGFPRRDQSYWLNSFAYLQSQIVPDGQPRFGWVMEQAGVIVGVILNIWRPPEYSIGGQLVANLSSWYVKPEFRSFAAMLLAKSSRDPKVIYLNVSPADHTVPICEALGFKLYSKGQVLALPSFAKSKESARVFQFGAEMADLLPSAERLLEVHAATGCMSLVGEVGGVHIPLVFVRRRVRSIIPTIQLIYIEKTDYLPRLFSAIGKFFIRQGRPILLCDFDRKFENVPSRYYPDRGSRYYKGTVAPTIGDLSFTEIAAFGI